GLVCLGSLLSVLAPNFLIFLAARVLTGIGVGTFLPAIMWVIANRFPVESQGQATGYWALVNSLGHAIGPTLGGFFLQFTGWQWIFLINVPLGLISILLAIKLFPKVPRATIERFDTPGAVAVAALTFCTMLAITMTAKNGITFPPTLLLWSGAIASLLFILFYERKQPAPFVDLSLFTNKKFLAAIFSISTQAFSQFGLLVCLPVFLIDIHNINNQIAGLLIMVMTMTMSILSPISGRMSDRWGSKLICQLGVGMIAAGGLYFLLVRTGLSDVWGWVLFTLGLIIFGIGFGFVQSASTVSVIQSIPSEKTSAATGFFHMIRFIVASLGSTVIGIILELNTGGLLSGYYQGFIVILSVALFTLPFTVWMVNQKKSLISV
ncbi:MAG TPA: MFS transporter, partial [Longilinea sp.]|nr:MFS transporter [Longilinea sp.]